MKGCKNLNKTVVAATFSKAKTYVLARFKIRDREVGRSNPLAPTNSITSRKALTAASIGGLFFGGGRFVADIIRLGRFRTLLIRGVLAENRGKK